MLIGENIYLLWILYYEVYIQQVMANRRLHVFGMVMAYIY